MVDEPNAVPRPLYPTVVGIQRRISAAVNGAMPPPTDADDPTENSDPVTSD